jgi:ABC-type transport system involved in cytochrome bd biosynthesis fused ATPase/permease subunit
LEHALTWQEYLSIGKRISQFLNISQPNEKKSISMCLQSPKESTLAFKLENVRFLDPPIPCSFSLAIPAGSVTWITGRTGVGKSTLFSLLLGMYHSSERGCCYSGTLQRIENARILIVTQQPTLFAGCSMRFNIDPRSLCKDDLQLFSLLSQVSLSISASLDGEEEEGLQQLQHVSLSMRRKIGIVRLLVEASAALQSGMKVVALFDETFDDEEELLSHLFSSRSSQPSLFSNPNVTCVIITHNPRLINDENCIDIG